VSEAVWDEKLRRQGPATYSYENGNLAAKGVYLHGKRFGMWVTYYPNGKLESQGSYEHSYGVGGRVDGYMEGYWEFRNIFGGLDAEESGTYHRGEKVDHR